MNRNQLRVLDEETILHVTKQVEIDLVEYSEGTAEALVDHYLRGDIEGLFETITTWIELAEDEVLNKQNQEST